MIRLAKNQKTNPEAITGSIMRMYVGSSKIILKTKVLSPVAIHSKAVILNLSKNWSK